MSLLVTTQFGREGEGIKKVVWQLGGEFQATVSLKEAVLAKAPDSVIEIDVVVQDGKCYFNRFFVPLDHASQVFGTVVDLT